MVYPAMIGSGEPLAAALATSYRDELGGIAEEVQSFLAQWTNSTVIGLGMERFREELFCLLQKL